MEHSPFGTLPAEVRNSIYELVLTYDHPLRITQKDHQDTTTSPKSIGALRNACRQIRCESTKLFFAVNTFVLPVDIDIDSPVKDLGPNLSAFYATIPDQIIGILHTVTIDIGVQSTLYDWYNLTMFDKPGTTLLSVLVFLASFKAGGSFLIRFHHHESLVAQSPKKVTIQTPVEGVHSTLMNLSKTVEGKLDELSGEDSDDAMETMRGLRRLAFIFDVLAYHANAKYLKIS